MTIVVSVIAIGFSVVIVAGWLVLLSAPLIVATGSIAGTTAMAATGVGRRARKAARDIGEGILVIDGLGDDGLLHQVRSDIGRVLQLAPAGTSPKACACVKSADGGGFVGVLRVYNAKGHYLLRETSDTISGVAQRITSTLRQFTEFPARVGSKRESCPECVPATCPLRRMAQAARASA